MIKEKKKKLGSGKKSGFALLFIVIAFLLSELILRLSGLFPPLGPFTEFEGPYGQKMVRFNLNHLKPEFTADKPPGAYRIMIAGGSSAVGFPYHPRSTFGLRLESILEAEIPGLDVEVIHIGKMSMYSTEVREVVDEAVNYSPDLMIIYSGHNEFIALNRKLSPGSRAALKVAMKSKVVLATGALLHAALGAGKTTFMQAWEENEEGGLALPRPPLISQDQYDEVVTEYEDNLRAMADACNNRKVKLVLCAPASNLNGWPPEYVFPASFGEKSRLEAGLAYDRAEKFYKSGAFFKAYSGLEEWMSSPVGYAPLAFISGRSKSADLKSLDPSSDKFKSLKISAIKDLETAVSWESKCVYSHRAPPEFRDIVKKVASEKSVVFLDAQAAINEAADFTPGFDLFEDHCHPNLKAQQVLAEALRNTMKENDIPVESSQYGPTFKWNENAFRDKNEIDDQFLKHVYQTMAIWTGLKKHLPDNSAFISERLRQCSVFSTIDPLPLILESVYAMTYGDSTGPLKRLSQFYYEQPDLIHKSLERYFTSRVDIRQDVFMARLNFDRDTPPLINIMKSGLFKEEEGGAHVYQNGNPLDYFDAFIDLADQGRSLTKEIEKGLEKHKAHAKSEDPIILADPAKAIVMPEGLESKLIKVSDVIEYEMKTSFSYITSGPVNIDPTSFSALEFRARTKNENHLVTLYWLGADSSGQAVNGFMDLDVSGPDGQTINLDAQPRWVLASSLQEIRVYPRMAGDFILEYLAILPEMNN